MTTLRIALAQSPIRSAYAVAQHGGVIEVRSLMVARADGQQTWTGSMRCALVINSQQQMCGSESEMIELTAYIPAPNGKRELDWQPVYERATPATRAKV